VDRFEPVEAGRDVFRDDERTDAELESELGHGAGPPGGGHDDLAGRDVLIQIPPKLAPSRRSNTGATTPALVCAVSQFRASTREMWRNLASSAASGLGRRSATARFGAGLPAPTGAAVAWMPEVIMARTAIEVAIHLARRSCLIVFLLVVEVHLLRVGSLITGWCAPAGGCDRLVER
jgi:hypothetical protein